MKHAIAGIVIGFVVAAFAVASCSIRHRSDEYACTRTADCTDGRVCDNGFCIVAGSIDAPKGDAGRADANNCPSPCTSCNVQQKTCTVDCQSTNCMSNVSCPAGYSCDILCNTESACRNGVTCSLATSCRIECMGKQSCENILCGPGPCDVNCTGTASCRGVLCANSCACDVVCTGSQSCAEGISCSSLACTSGSGCTSVPALCHSCN